MIRRYTRAEYVARAERLKRARSGLTLSTDVIVGFPGETDDDFEQTLSLVREVGFVSLFGFKYSPRPQTPALRLGDERARRATKAERLARASSRSPRSSAPRTCRASSGRSTRCSSRARARARRATCTARSRPGAHGAEARSSTSPRQGRWRLVGQVVGVEIVQAHRHSLAGQLTSPLPRRLPARPCPARRPEGEARRLPVW